MTKQILNTILLLLTLCSCKAQNPIVSLDAKRHKTVDGAYYKDLNNELDKFEGTWVFTNGTTTFTLVLKKKEQFAVNNDFRDFILGEYQFVDNGVEIVNTLPLLPQNLNDIDNGSVGGGNFILNHVYPVCDDCPPNERRLELYFYDSERKYLSISLVLRYLQDANHLGQEAQMTATLVSDGGSMLPQDDSPSAPRVPYGDHLMVKQ